MQGRGGVGLQPASSARSFATRFLGIKGNSAGGSTRGHVTKGLSNDQPLAKHRWSDSKTLLVVGQGVGDSMATNQPYGMGLKGPRKKQLLGG